MDYKLYKKIKIRKPKTEADEINVVATQLIDIRADDIAIRNAGSLAGKAIFLNDSLNGQCVARWIIVRDEANVVCVVPLAPSIKDE